MLEAILFNSGGSEGFNGPWNGVLPPADANTLFRMHTFTAVGDIRDKSVNSIPVTNTNVTVGTDIHGSYMQFNGTNAFLAFQNALLSTNSLDITIILGNVVYPTSAIYAITILDGRPNITNGRYLTFGANQTAPFTTNIIYSGIGYSPTISVPAVQSPMVITIKVRTGSFTVVVNGKEVQSVVLADNALTNPQVWRVGRNAYVQQAVTPWLNGRIYYLDFKKV